MRPRDPRIPAQMDKHFRAVQEESSVLLLSCLGFEDSSGTFSSDGFGNLDREPALEGLKRQDILSKWKVCRRSGTGLCQPWFKFNRRSGTP